ncbi:MAG: PQQ-binding-like beta-propeller repeat protein [Armatimonadetes bacterium]|nr:PQQ-binding-like beta-propeller repeat protein [Armatimonadota bacterium]
MPFAASSRGIGLLALWLTASGTLAAVYPPLKPAWQLHCDNGFYAPPTVVGTTVYASDVDGRVRAVGLEDGAVRWSYAANDSVYTGVAVGDGLAYVGSVDRYLYALDLDTGRVAWSKELDGVIYATPELADGLVLVGTGTSGTLYALDARTGDQRWTFTMGARLGSGLALADGVVYAPSYDKHLYAIDLANGQAKWQYEVDTVVDSRPLPADGAVYVKLTNDSVCALNAETGKLLWQTPPLTEVTNDEPTTWSPLTRAGKLLMFAMSDGRLQAVNVADGQPAWTTEAAAPCAAPPAPAGEVGYVGTKDGSLAAVDLATGTIGWDWQPAGVTQPALISGIMWPPVVVGKWVLAASMDGQLYAFQGEPDGAAWQKARQAALAAARGPGRIAVGGLYPIGYVGCLARHGLPRDVLYDAQLADLETLKGYDLVVLAGAPRDPAIGEAVQKYLEGGGTAIIDYSGTAIAMPNLPNHAELVGWTEGSSPTPGGFRVGGLSLAPLPIAAKAGRLAGIALAVGLVGEKCVGYVPDASGLKGVQVLAQYPATVLEHKDTAKVDTTGGPAGPAVVVGRKGQGRVILCGLQVAQKTEYAGLDLEALILAMVGLATRGRAVGQLVPDTPHVGYNATLRSVSGGAAAAGPEEEPPAPADSGPVKGPGARSKLPKGFTLIEADPADEYDFTAKVPARAAEVLLRYWNTGNFVRVNVSPSSIDIARSSQGRLQPLDGVKVKLAPGDPLTIRERCETLTVRSGLTYLRVDLAGLHPGSLGQRGLSSEAAYEPAESVYFTDDFMRTDEHAGPWQTSGGKWSTTPELNPDMGSNPFSYKCEARDGVATAVGGEEFWNEYQVSCAVRPNLGDGSVGLGWYAKDADNMYLLRSALRKDGAPRADGFQLVRLVNGAATVLAECPGGLSAGQWYELHIKAEGPWLSADVDGARILSTQDTTFTGGKVALRAEHASARFDDVVARAAVLMPESGARIEGKAPNRAGLIDVDSWASPAMGWEPDPDLDGLFWRRDTVYGDADLDFEWAKLPDGATLSLVVDGDGRELDSGYVVQLQRAGKLDRLELRHSGSVLKTADVTLGEPVKLAIRRRTAPPAAGAPMVRIEGLIGGAAALSAVVPALGKGGRLGFRTIGFQPRISALTVWSSNLRDYTFDTAPCDWWVASGTWDLTNRWSCVPEWSWFGGFSSGQAVVWNKQQFAGDLEVDYYVGSKMLDGKTPGYQGPSQERTGDFNVTLCGDGHSTDSGYSFRIGPAGAPGEIRKGGRVSGATAQLRRNGKVVAQNDRFRFFSEAHNRWADIRVEKHGGIVTLRVDGQPVIEYRDPEPLDQGFVAIWTQNNGILLPRITIASESLGKELLSLR